MPSGRSLHDSPLSPEPGSGEDRAMSARARTLNPKPKAQSSNRIDKLRILNSTKDTPFSTYTLLYNAGACQVTGCYRLSQEHDPFLQAIRRYTGGRSWDLPDKKPHARLSVQNFSKS